MDYLRHILALASANQVFWEHESCIADSFSQTFSRCGLKPRSRWKNGSVLQQTVLFGVIIIHLLLVLLVFVLWFQSP